VAILVEEEPRAGGVSKGKKGLGVNLMRSFQRFGVPGCICFVHLGEILITGDICLGSFRKVYIGALYIGREKSFPTILHT
jgi:hypothetical protein